jgi:hypothetical protein
MAGKEGRGVYHLRCAFDESKVRDVVGRKRMVYAVDA